MSLSLRIGSNLRGSDLAVFSSVENEARVADICRIGSTFQ